MAAFIVNFLQSVESKIGFEQVFSEVLTNKPKSKSKNGELYDEKGTPPYFFWILVFLIYFISLTNMILLSTMLISINFGKNPQILDAPAGSIKFIQNSELPYIYKDDGKIYGFQDTPFEISGKDKEVLNVYIKDREGASRVRFEVDPNKIEFSGANKFEFIDRDSGERFFHTDFKKLSLPEDLKTLDVKMLKVGRIISPGNDSLSLKSDHITRVYGNKGIRVEGKEILIHADGDILFVSVDSDFNILTNDFRVDFEKMPISLPDPNDPYVPEFQYKLCACMPMGRLFMTAVEKDRNSDLECNYVDKTAPDFLCRE